MRKQDCTGLNVAAHPGRKRAMKKTVPVRVCFAACAGLAATREGTISYQAGDALLTGAEGERWPVARKRFFASYEALPPAVMGKDGLYIKKRLPVWALRISEPFSVATERGLLSGQAGDWLVQYGPEDYGVVGASIFAATYAMLPDEEQQSSRG